MNKEEQLKINAKFQKQIIICCEAKGWSCG